MCVGVGNLGKCSANQTWNSMLHFIFISVETGFWTVTVADIKKA